MIKEELFKKMFKKLWISKGRVGNDNEIIHLMAVYYDILKNLPYIEEVMSNALIKSYRRGFPEASELYCDHKELSVKKRDMEHSEFREREKRDTRSGNAGIFLQILKNRCLGIITQEDAEQQMERVCNGQI